MRLLCRSPLKGALPSRYDSEDPDWQAATFRKVLVDPVEGVSETTAPPQWCIDEDWAVWYMSADVRVLFVNWGHGRENPAWHALFHTCPSYRGLVGAAVILQPGVNLDVPTAVRLVSEGFVKYERNKPSRLPPNRSLSGGVQRKARAGRGNAAQVLRAYMVPGPQSYRAVAAKRSRAT
jgi:hypothetical protein